MPSFDPWPVPVWRLWRNGCKGTYTRCPDTALEGIRFGMFRSVASSRRQCQGFAVPAGGWTFLRVLAFSSYSPQKLASSSHKICFFCEKRPLNANILKFRYDTIHPHTDTLVKFHPNLFSFARDIRENVFHSLCFSPTIKGHTKFKLGRSVVKFRVMWSEMFI